VASNVAKMRVTVHPYTGFFEAARGETHLIVEVRDSISVGGPTTKTSLEFIAKWLTEIHPKMIHTHIPAARATVFSDLGKKM